MGDKTSCTESLKEVSNSCVISVTNQGESTVKVRIMSEDIRVVFQTLAKVTG